MSHPIRRANAVLATLDRLAGRWLDTPAPSAAQAYLALIQH